MDEIPYKRSKEYFLTIRFESKYYRLLKFEQGIDKSFYVKWSLSLSRNKDGDYGHRSYWSYHYKFDKKNDGYRVHCHGCGGNRISDSIEYRKKFIAEYETEFLKFGINALSENEIVVSPTEKDIIFDIHDEKIEKYEVILFSEKRADLLKKDCDNMQSRLIGLEGYNLIVSLFKKLE